MNAPQDDGGNGSRNEASAWALAPGRECVGFAGPGAPEARLPQVLHFYSNCYCRVKTLECLPPTLSPTGYGAVNINQAFFSPTISY